MIAMQKSSCSVEYSMSAAGKSAARIWSLSRTEPPNSATSARLSVLLPVPPESGHQDQHGFEDIGKKDTVFGANSTTMSYRGPSGPRNLHLFATADSSPLKRFGMTRVRNLLAER